MVSPLKRSETERETESFRPPFHQPNIAFLPKKLKSRMSSDLLETESLFHIRQHSLSLRDDFGVSPLFYPQKLCLQLDDIELWKEPVKLVANEQVFGSGGTLASFEESVRKPVLASLAEKSSIAAVSLSQASSDAYLVCPVQKYKISRVAFCYRDQRQIRHASRYDGKTKFNLSYHSLMFDVIKVNLLKKGFESHGKYAQAVIKLSELESYKDGAHIVRVPLVDYKTKDTRVGTVSILLQFYDFLVQDYSLLFRGLSMTCDPDELSSPSSQSSSVSSSILSKSIRISRAAALLCRHLQILPHPQATTAARSMTLY